MPDNIQTPGRKANAAQPLDASDNEAGAERYPPARRDDAVEHSAHTGEDRSFEPPKNPEPPQGAGDGSAPPTTDTTTDTTTGKR